MILLNSRVLPNRYAASSLVAVFILILNSLFFNSVFMNILPLSGYFVVALNAAAIVFLMTIKSRIVGSLYVLVFFVSIFLSAMQAIYFSDLYYLAYSGFFFLSLFVVMLCSMKDLSVLVDILSIVFFLMLIFAIFAFILALLGIDPVYVTENRDGRPLYYFYFSFTNSYYGNLMRPSGIFDEPGAFSFYISALCCLRVLLGKDERLTFYILLMGFITMSLAHVIFFFLYVISQARLRKVFNFRSVVLFFVVFSAAFYFMGDIFYDMLFSRFDLGGDGLVAGDNRSNLIMNALQFIYENPKSILVGIGPECLLNHQSCALLMPHFNSNPFEPLIRVGLLQSWLYYLLLLVAFIAPFFGRRYFVVFGFGLLLLQRPYLMHVSYSLYSVVIVCITLGVVVSKINQILAASSISASAHYLKWTPKVEQVPKL
ncbi:hypothetical protein [Marinobacter sp.]|uniref:hypothetical protein n=1 Tax=Marinobacter sp. TaxID=50741 RepID=UPI00262A3FAB|nr:hypothetical protein [Marinobacter sp.]